MFIEYWYMGANTRSLEYPAVICKTRESPKRAENMSHELLNISVVHARNDTNVFLFKR